jgi:hypothetical protein
VYEFYRSIADKRVIEARRREVDFYRDLLNGFRKRGLIFDIRTNRGSKSDFFLWLGARVIEVEPDEVDQEILREKFIRYRLTHKSIAYCWQGSE